MNNLRFALLLFSLSLLVPVRASFAQTAGEFVVRAQTAQNKGDYAAMVKNADEAVKRDATSGIAYFLRGLGYFLLDKNAEAEADAAKVIELNPAQMEGYFLHASALIVSRPDDWKIALADFDKAIKLDSTYPNAFRGRAYLHNEFDHDYAAALVDANQAVKLDPQYADGFYELGRATQNLKNYAAAESNYSNAVKLGKKTANIYNFRGVVYFLENKKDQAVADFRQALAIEPDNIQAKENLELATAKTPANDAVSAIIPQNSQPNIGIQLAFSNSTYEKVMPAAEKIFKKLTTHHYPAPKEISFMGRTTIVDSFGEDKNTLAVRINSVLQAMQNILESPYASELTAEQRQMYQARYDKITALQAEAARLNLVTLVK